MNSKRKHIQNSRHSRYCESLKYSLHRPLRKLDIFRTLVYSSPSIPRIREIWGTVFYRTLCNTGIFRTRGISESCVTLAYLKSWDTENQKDIHNTVKDLSWNIYSKFFYNPDIFRTLLYSSLWYILKNKHIQNTTKYLRWSILLRTL